MMTRDGYPAVQEHKERHKELLGYLCAIQGNVVAGILRCGSSLIENLFDWEDTHIKGSDAEYVDFLRTKGSLISSLSG